MGDSGHFKPHCSFWRAKLPNSVTLHEPNRGMPGQEPCRSQVIPGVTAPQSLLYKNKISRRSCFSKNVSLKAWVSCRLDPFLWEPFLATRRYHRSSYHEDGHRAVSPSRLNCSAKPWCF